MILDSSLLFSVAQSLATDTDTPSSTVIDLTGGVSMNVGVQSRFMADMGLAEGVGMPKLVAYVGTAFATSGSATLNVKFQGSTDNSTFTTYAETGPIAASRLTAGRKIAEFDWPPVPEGVSMPRYVRLLYGLPGSQTFSAGTIAIAGVVLQRDGIRYYGPGFKVAQ
jgi:hypothetical protein